MKRIYCANNNTVYKSAAEASRELNVSRDLISKAASGVIAHAKYFVFQYIEDEDPELDPEAIRRRLLYNAFKIKL